MDITFWVLLNLYFDPGGFVSGFMGGNIFGRVNLTDIIIIGIIFCLYAIKPQKKYINQNYLFRKFLNVFSIYLLYYFVIYAGLVPYLQKDLDYFLFLYKERTVIYGVIILFSIYYFSLRGLRPLFYTTLFFGSLSLTLFLFTVVTGYEILPVVRLERYHGSGIMRIAMYSYGIFDMLFPISLITLLISGRLNINIKYKRWLYYAGLLMLIITLITLTRREIVRMAFLLIIIPLMLNYIYHIGNIKATLKYIIPSIILILLISITMPKYLGYVANISKDTYSLITTGQDSRGKGDYRISGTGDLAEVKEDIKNNLLLGTGYSSLYWGEKGYASSTRGDEYARKADAAGEVPIYYVFFGFGLVGALIICYLYYLLLKNALIIMKSLKRNTHVLLKNPIDLIFSLYILVWTIYKFTIGAYAIGTDFRGGSIANVGIIVGVGYALIFKMSHGFYIKNTKST